MSWFLAFAVAGRGLDGRRAGRGRFDGCATPELTFVPGS